MKKNLPDRPVENLSDGMRAALKLLWQAREMALVFGKDVWNFAVGFSVLHAAGLSENELRALTCARHVQHAEEIDSEENRERVFRATGDFRIRPCTAVILTEQGALLVHEAQLADRSELLALCGTLLRGAETLGAVKPTWDKALRQLRLGQHIVKQFSKPAQWQELILDCLEEEGWCPYIDDPLPPQANQDPVEHLHSVLRSLNELQELPGIRFYRDGTGRIRWQLRCSENDKPVRAPRPCRNGH